MKIWIIAGCLLLLLGATLAWKHHENTKSEMVKLELELEIERKRDDLDWIDGEVASIKESIDSHNFKGSDMDELRNLLKKSLTHL